MNNQDKNTYVKRQITNTLLELLKEKELSDINIGEITDKAEVSRNSFYRNYADKEDIIRKYLYQFLSEWDAEWKQKNSDSNAELFGHLFMYLKQHGDMMMLIQKRGLFHLFKESYISIWGPSETMDNMTAYTLSFIANGVLGWIEEWLKRGMCESSETMSSLLNMYGMS
ncbi:MAG: TetR/AcrR family transcriptional regulator [Butyrivibrio sp.]|nr:TetR/AcrR family transcriptional regulator [Butyrivibrio sp.]